MKIASSARCVYGTRNKSRRKRNKTVKNLRF
jgi:hypothetical protein